MLSKHHRAVRIWTLIYFLTHADEILDYQSISRDEFWKIMFFFDIPFECMIAAIIVQFF